ncbi:MAG: hypothetical protein AAF202_03080 [Pseudomonadota bacterium]
MSHQVFPANVKNLALTPLKPELTALIEGLKSSGETVQSLGSNQFLVEKLSLGLGLGGHSKSEFAARASRALTSNSQVENLFCCGTSGSLTETAKPLDVVVGKSTTEHDFHSKFLNTGKLPVFESSLFSKLSEFAIHENTSYSTHIGGIASGNEDIVSRQRATELHLKTQCLVVAWEGAGGARAALANSVNYLEIRAVSDVCDNQTESQFQQNLSPSMKNCASVLLKVLQALGASGFS